MKRYPLVMLPGLDGTGLMFKPILNELKGEVDPIVISYDHEIAYGYEDLVEKVADSLPKEDFFILGESFSGPIALMLAARKPKGLKGVILCASFVSNPSAIFPSFLSFMIGAPLFNVWPVSVKINVLTTGRANGNIKRLVIETKELTSNKVLASRTRETLKVNVVEELKNCHYPMLYLRGSKDMVVWGHNLRKIIRLKNDISHVTLDASHLVLQEAPMSSAKEIVKFIEAAT